MQQVFVEDAAVRENTVTITGEDARHLAGVVRIKNGEKVRISTQGGESFLGTVILASKDEVVCEITERSLADTELKGEILLFQALPKGDRLDFIVQKVVELGASAVYPVTMDYCITKWESSKISKKVSRYQAIAEAAAKQSKRSRLPVFESPVNFREALSIAKERCDVLLLPYENEKGMAGTLETIEKIKPESKVAIFIGPEGGFSEKEIELAKGEAEFLSLGRRILRTDTAAILAVGYVMMKMEAEMETDHDLS